MPSLDDRDEHDVRCFHWQQTPAVKTIPLEITRRQHQTDHRTVLQVEGLHAEHRSRREAVVAASNVSFTVERGACVALVGESGSGKTTIARAIAGLHPVAKGRILLDGESFQPRAPPQNVDQRRRIQLVFQNPAAALNPRHTVRGHD